MKKLLYKGHPHKIMDDEFAEKIITQMKRSPRPLHIEINGEFLKTSMIEIRDDDLMMAEDKQQMREDKFRRNFEDWVSEWKRKVQLPPEVKAQNACGYFSAWWYAYTASYEVPLDVWEKAKPRALLYFRKYTNRLLPNPNIWKDLFPEPVEPQRIERLTHTRELLQPRMMHHLTMALMKICR